MVYSSTIYMVNGFNYQSTLCYCSTHWQFYGKNGLFIDTLGTDVNNINTNIFSTAVYSYLVQNTYWYWNSTNAYIGTVLNSTNPLCFTYTYINNTTSPITAYLMYSCNTISVYLNNNILNNNNNNNIILSYNFNVTPGTITLVPGNNILNFYCKNNLSTDQFSQPVGFSCVCFKNLVIQPQNPQDNILFNTNVNFSGWTMNITGYSYTTIANLQNVTVKWIDCLYLATNSNWNYNDSTYGNFGYNIGSSYDISYNQTYGLDPSSNGVITTGYNTTITNQGNNPITGDIGSILSTSIYGAKINLSYYNWTKYNPSIKWNSNLNITPSSKTIALSSDGQVQLIGIPTTTTVYYSKDFGLSYSIVNGIINNVTGCALSSDGTYGLITTSSINVYFSNNSCSSFSLVQSYTALSYVYTGCAISSSGRFMCIIDRYNGYRYTNDFGSSWNPYYTFQTTNATSDQWGNRFAVVLDKEGTGSNGQPRVYMSNINTTGSLVWYDNFFVSQTTTASSGSNTYTSAVDGFYSMYISGNYLYALYSGIFESSTSTKFLQFNTTTNSWNSQTLSKNTNIISMSVTQSGKVYFTSSLSLSTGNNNSGLIYTMNNNTLSTPTLSTPTLYTNSYFSSVNTNQTASLICVSQDGRCIVCVNPYTNSSSIYLYKNGNPSNT